MSQEQALIKIEEINPAVVFTQDGIEPVIAHIEQIGRELVPDTSTGKGRQEIKSLSFKIARSKTLLDDAGKEYVADIKAKVKVVDGARKAARDRLDALREEVRKPLTEWEEEQERIKAEKERAERERIDKIQALIDENLNLDLISMQDKSALQIHARVKRIAGIEIDPEIYQEFTDQAIQKRDDLVASLQQLCAQKREQEEADRKRQEEEARLAAEREALKKERAELAAMKAEQERKEREAQEKAEEEARAKAEAERKAREAQELAEREERERQEEEARAKAEAERLVALRPDKEKIITFMDSLNATALAAAGGLDLQSDEARSLLEDAVAQIENVTTGIVTRCHSL